MKLNYFDFVFVVLVYRNTRDLRDFFSNFDIPNSKVIVVNSYFDDYTETEFRRIASAYNADFLNVENKGYGAGNNRGIEYALQHYEFDFLIISNADINIKKFDVNLSNEVITAPDLVTLKGKHQNPHTPLRMPILDKMRYKAFLKNNKNYLIIPLGINKLLRRIFRILNKLGWKKIYTPHGAFIIFPYSIIKQLHPLFDERMFLFAEEDVLAWKASLYNISVVYNAQIKILHKEDGSVSELKGEISRILRDSNIFFYENYIKSIKNTL